MSTETKPHDSYFPRSYTDGKILEITYYYRHMKKHERCSKMGTILRCPYCTSHSTVYHLAWSAVVCDKCDNSVNKEDWLVQIGREEGEWI